MGNFYENLFLYFSFFFIAIISSFLINGLFLKYASNLGIRSTSETGIRWSSTSKPAFGGISFYVIFFTSIISYSILFHEKNIFADLKLIGILSAVTLAFLMGLADDAYNTKPFLKFLVQFLCGIILISTGTYISIFPNEYLNYSITILWIIGIMNSINMLDNMDAITTVVSGSIIVAAMVVILVIHQIDGVNFFILIGVLASLIGFLFYNWHPSKIYMGDTGSQFLGCFLGIIGITYFWNNPTVDTSTIPEKQILTTLIIFIIPLVDTTSVTIGRLMKRQSPFIGGKDHTTHHLSYLGLSDRQVALTFLGLSIVSIILLYIIQSVIENWNILHFMYFSIYILTVSSILFYVTRINKKENRSKTHG